MAKTVLQSKIQEWKGLDKINMVVHGMNCIFREITKDDFGIDGEIEIVVSKADGKGLETTGEFIKVQAKSGESYVKQDSENSFFTPIEKNDLENWYHSTNEVIFVVYHPKDDKLYWKNIKAYARSTPNLFQPPLRIAFDKSADEFTVQSYKQLCAAAKGSAPRVSFQEKERLFSNLLPIKKIPKIITSAPTEWKTYLELGNELTDFVPPFCVVPPNLYTLADLRNENCVLRSYCNTKRISDVSSNTWISDPIRMNDYIFLLNQLLGIHLKACVLRYNREFRRNYFPRQDKETLEFKKDWYNVRTNRRAPKRILAKYYEYGFDHFWRHLAVNLSFRIIGKAWYLQIIPKYLYTVDGEIPFDSTKVGPYTTSIKAKERNIHVLNHVLFWSDVLSRGEKNVSIWLDSRVLNMKIQRLAWQSLARLGKTYPVCILPKSNWASLVRGKLSLGQERGSRNVAPQLKVKTSRVLGFVQQ
ncbi:MAG: DUF4365 domain-containing protein [Chloroflexi bacterium]|nr:DUF4365 domain-containing protein [Chloroflexota bacterium]